ncbi:hypothetical protein HDK64DRAFT_275212 [Phyllosticta capitalensis]
MPTPSRGDAVASKRLLRALLREATYLPDPAARQFVRRHVLSAFDNYRVDPATPDSKLDNLKFSAGRIREKFRQARKGLGQLRRANEGEIRPLERILSWTYGRRGPLRYELLRKHLLVPDDVHGQQAVDLHYDQLLKSDPRVVLDGLPGAVVEVPRKNPIEAEEPRVFEISPRYPRLKGFIEATVRNSHLIVSRSAKLKRTKFSVPARNTWQRPMPLNRARNQVEEWYANVLDKIQPPLKTEDWERLRGLVLGDIAWEGPRPRRPRALEMEAHWSQYDVDKLIRYGFSAGDYRLDLSLRHLRLSEEGTKEEKVARLAQAARSHLNPDDLYLGQDSLHPAASEKLLRHQLEIERLPTKMPGKDRAVRITCRSMRRLWAKIFAQCPVMWYDEGKKKWDAKWGSSLLSDPDSNFEASTDDLFLFEGAKLAPEGKKGRAGRRPKNKESSGPNRQEGEENLKPSEDRALAE